MSDAGLAAMLHTAVCQAVAQLNVSVDALRSSEVRPVRDLLRQALIDYADAFMDQPAPERERAAIAGKHRGESA